MPSRVTAFLGEKRGYSALESFRFVILGDRRVRRDGFYEQVCKAAVEDPTFVVTEETQLKAA